MQSIYPDVLKQRIVNECQQISSQISQNGKVVVGAYL